MTGARSNNPLDNQVTIENNIGNFRVGSSVTILWAANRTKGCADTINGPVTRSIQGIGKCAKYDKCRFYSGGYCTTDRKIITLEEHDGSSYMQDLCVSIIKNLTTKFAVKALLNQGVDNITQNYKGISIDNFKFNKKGVVIDLDWRK